MKRLFLFCIVGVTFLNIKLSGCDNQNASKDCCFFVMSGCGYSSSLCTCICADAYVYGTPSEGYSDKLGSAPILEAAMGYNFRPWLAASFSAAYRGVYRYRKHQTFLHDGPLLNMTTPSLVRYFDVENMSVFVNLIMSGVDCFEWRCCDCLSLAPRIAGGLGFSRSKMSNFHSVLDRAITGLPSSTYYAIQILAEENCKPTWGAQADVGVALKLGSRARFDFGYRFFYGNKFKSNNYIVYPPIDTSTSTQFAKPITLPPWHISSLMAHEFFVQMRYDF